MKLTTKARKKIASKNFALPGRRYPIEDSRHAANAKARVSQFGRPAEKARVDSAVKRKYGFKHGGAIKKMKSGGVMTCPSYKAGGVTHRVRGEHFQ